MPYSPETEQPARLIAQIGNVQLSVAGGWFIVTVAGHHAGGGSRLATLYGLFLFKAGIIERFTLD